MAVIVRVSAVKTVFIFALSLFYSSLVSLGLLLGIIIKGPFKFFKIEKRNRPDKLDDKSYGDHHFARLKKIRIHYVAKGGEDKPLMLFVHGFPEFWYSWRHQLKAFGGDYRAVAMDMRGYSESEKPQGKINYTLDKLVDDIKELIPALGYEKCILVGHDWGGAVTWAFAHMYPEMVERVIVCNCPSFPVLNKQIYSSIKQFKRSWYMFLFQMPWLQEALIQSDDLKAFEQMMGKVKGNSKEDIEMYQYTFQFPDALTGPLNFYRAALQYEPMLMYPTEKIKVPSLMIWGTEDRALGRELAELQGQTVDKYTVRYIEGASHWVAQERPEEVNQFIREFLADEIVER